MDPAAFQLPQPDAAWTVPAAIALGVIALLSLLKKLIVLAVILAVLAAGFVAYQNGAFDRWVDQGKSKIELNVG
jgi:hypothetical protein